MVECLRIPVGEFGFANLGLRVGDDPTRVGVVRVDSSQLPRGGHDGIPSPGLMQGRHLIHQCFPSLGHACLFKPSTDVGVGRVEGGQIFQRGHHDVPVTLSGGSLGLARPDVDVSLSACLFQPCLDPPLTRIGGLQRLEPFYGFGPAFGEKGAQCVSPLGIGQQVPAPLGRCLRRGRRCSS